MIARHWRGLARRECADAYVEHLQSETFPQLVQLPGFHDASILRRDVPEGVEFLIVTVWTSLDAIRSFAGSDAESAVVLDHHRLDFLRHDRGRGTTKWSIDSTTGESARSRATDATLPSVHPARAP